MELRFINFSFAVVLPFCLSILIFFPSLFFSSSLFLTYFHLYLIPPSLHLSVLVISVQSVGVANIHVLKLQESVLSDQYIVVYFVLEHCRKRTLFWDILTMREIYFLMFSVLISLITVELLRSVEWWNGLSGTKTRIIWSIPCTMKIFFWSQCIL